jgi:hypothetical protein
MRSCASRDRQGLSFMRHGGMTVGEPNMPNDTPEWECCEIVVQAQLVRPLGAIRPAVAEYAFSTSGTGPRGLFPAPTSPHRVRQKFYGPGSSFMAYDGDVLITSESGEAMRALVREPIEQG